MHYLLKNVKKIMLAFIVLSMIVGQMELFGDVYAKELEKINDQSPYGELYNTDINNVNNEDAVIMKTENPEVITKEPVIEEEDDSHKNDKEIESLRTENTKTYELSDGEYVTDFYFMPIHKKEDGKFVEINNDLEKKTSFLRSTPSYENKDGLYDFSVNNGVIEIKDEDGNALTILPKGSLGNYAIKENVILYSEIEKNMDLEYRINANTVTQNIYINGELDKYDYSFEVYKDGYDIKKDEAGSIQFVKDGKEVYTLMAPYLTDKDGNRNQEVSYDYKNLDNGNIEVTLHIGDEWLKEENRVFPVTARANVEVGNVEVIDLNSSYIRSGMPDIQSQYSDLFVGYDDDFYGGKGSNIKIARTFIYFGMPNIGENQRIDSAVLKLYKEQDLDYANELNDINVYNADYVNPSTVTWNNQPSASSKQLVSHVEFSKPKGWKEFDITKHVQELQEGKKKTLILQVTDESSKYNCNVFNSESTGNLPKVEIYHRDDFDIDPNLDINQFDNELRVYAKNGQYFEAISMDGIAKPNSDIQFDLYAKVNDTDFEFVKTQKAKDQSSPYFIDPIYVTDPIDGVQKYEKGEVNYTTNYLRIGEIPKYDTFYEYRMKVINGDTESEKELITDGFIIYKVKLGDNLRSIASHYGLKVEDIKKDNNTSDNKIKEGDILFLRFAKNNPKVPKDVYRPPLKLSSFEAKYVYRGPSCYGSCATADPVNTSIGNFYHESDDFTLTDFDELALTRVYNSYGEDNASIFGTNFSSNFEQYVAYDKDDNMLFFRGDGKILKINKVDGKYSPRLVDKVKVTIDGDKVSIYDIRTELTYVFDEYGMLSSIQTKNGFESVINYDEYGWIKDIDLGDKSVKFEYNDYNLVSKITLPNDTSVQYKYNADRQLTEFIDANGNSEKYAYDDNGKIKNITDKNGNVLAQNTYTDDGVVTSQTDANGNKVDFGYNGNQTSVTYNGKETETYVLDDNYKTTKITRGDGTSTSYEYNDAGRLISETDELGQKTSYKYDSNGNLLSQTNPDGTSEKYTYDANGNVTSKTSADGTVETYRYDQNNNVIYKDTSDTQKTTYEYNDQNLVVKETNALGVWKKYEYDGNLITKITHSNGLVESFVYDSMGNVIKESDSNGRSTSYVYDNMNNIIQKTDSYGKSEHFKYDGNGNLIEYIDKLGGKTVNKYDKNNNLVSSVKGNVKTSKTYDNHNRILSETDEQGLTVKYVYDAKGQKIKETDAYGNTTTYEYDAIGRNIKTTDGKGNVTVNEYDGDNLVKTTDARGQVTAYEYDDHNRVTKITLPNGKTQTTQYDDRGNIIKTVNERGLTNTKEYDSYDRVVKETNEQGVVIVNVYDAYGQIVKKTEDDKVTTYEYDVYGNVIKETDTYDHSKTNEYDKLDRLVKETDELGYVTEHKYDAMDHEIETIDANGNSKKKIYDINSVLVQEIDKLGNITTYKYNDKGYQTQAIDAYKNVTKYEYDQYGNVTKIYINDTLVESNEYDKYGRNIKKDTVNEVVTNEYDSFDQITKTTNETTGLVTTNKYDKYGNVTETSDNGGKTVKNTYDAYNQLTESIDAYGRKSTTEYDKYGQAVKEINASNEATSIVYDKYGNVIKTTDHLGSVTVSTYDLLNRKLTDTVDGKKTLTYSYDTKGQLISTHDSVTDKTDKSKYDGMGQVIETTDKLGNVTKTKYDAKGQVIKTTDALGHSSTVEYDIYGNIIKETDALGHSKQTKYNALGLVIQEVDERGFEQTYKYNNKFQPIEVTDKLGKTMKIEYNAQGYVSKTINQNGYATTFEYDIYGQTVKETDPNGNVKETEYDLLGNVIKESVPNRVTVNEYDSLGRLVSTKQNNKTKTTKVYNDLNQIVSETNALGYKTSYEYDKYGNTTKETFGDHVTISQYDLNNQLIKETINEDKIKVYEYDALGQEIRQSINGKDVLVQSYDAVGNVTAKTENGVKTRYVYDALGHVTEYQYPEMEDAQKFKTIVSVKYDESGNAIEYKDIYDHVIKRSYDANNNVVSETNTNGFTTKYEYDSLSNLMKVQSPLERVVKYEYDGNNNMVKRIFNDKEATYDYDENDNLIKEISEYGMTEEYTYDADGNMTSLTKNDGTTIKYTYDAMGRKLSEGSRTFEYDIYDNMTKASYDGKTIEYAYDKYNNIIKVDDANDNVVEYQWDIYGNRTQLKYKDNVISYTYNQFNKIDKVYKNSEEYASYSYDSRGNTLSFERNGIVTDYSYDELNRRTEYVNTKGDKVLSTYQYQYDGENNIISETINGKKNTYTYNESDELKTSSKTIDDEVVNTEYKYDLFGNRIETSDNGQSKVYHYNDKNQLTNIKEDGVGMTDIYYDDNGNMIDILYAGGYREHYEYDEFDQVTKLQTNRERTWTYEYDAEGDRIHEDKKVKDKSLEGNSKPDQDLWYDYLQSLKFTEVKELLEDKNADDTFDSLRSQIVFRNEHKGICASGIGRPVDPHETDSSTDYVLDKTAEDALILAANDEFSIYGEERISTESDEERLTYISGLNQSVFATVTQDTSIAQLDDIMETVTYDDFGNTVDMVGGFGYNGERLDESGNIYLRARYYNPKLGQFIQIDTNRGEQESIASQQRYTYCANNQYKYVDPSGHFLSGLKNILNGVDQLVKTTKKKIADTAKNMVSSAIKGAAGIAKTIVNTLTGKNSSSNSKKNNSTKINDGSDRNKKTTSNKSTNTKIKVEEPAPCPEPISSKALDVLQFILDVIGFVPGVGDFADAINAFISFARGNPLEAMISIGCIVFTVVADTLLKPLKWAAGSAVEIARKIADKLPNFASKTISYVKSIPGAIKQIPLVNKGYDTIKNIATNLANYIDNLFAKATKKVTVRFTGVRQISDELYRKLRRKTPSEEIKNMVNIGIENKIGTLDEALGEVITGRLEADHIISFDRLTKIEGFDKLTYEQQLKIINDPKNFIGMTKSANSSRGSRTFAEWTMHKSKKIKVNEEFRQRMMKKEKELEKYFIVEISKLIN